MRSKVLPASPGRAAVGLGILAIWVPTLLVFWPVLKIALGMALRDDRYLQVALAPLASLFLIVWQRAEIFSQAHYSPRLGIPLVSLAMLLGIISSAQDLDGESTGLLFAVLALIFVWIAAFILYYGPRTFQAALYPLCCLFLMVPLPPSWMDWIATGLQQGSAALSFEILRFSGIPVLRHGTQFSLPGLDFEVAPECSGIRSSLALMMVAIVTAYMYLQSCWTRLTLILLTLPIVLLKNSVRIVVISTLGAYVDRGFIDGPFHHEYGGLIFSVLGVALLVALLARLQGLEKPTQD